MWLKGKQRVMEEKLLETFKVSGTMKYLEIPSNAPKETEDLKTPSHVRVVDTHRHAIVHAIKHAMLILLIGCQKVTKKAWRIDHMKLMTYGLFFRLSWSLISSLNILPNVPISSTNIICGT